MFHYHFDFYDANDRHQDVLFIFIGAEQFDDTRLLDIVERQIQGALVPSEVIIAVPSTIASTIKNLFEISENLTTLKARLNNASLVLLTYDELGKESEAFSILDNGIVKPSISLQQIKRRALTDLFREREGFVASNNSYHFKNPSGRHTERFMRLTNILVHWEEISFIAFCILQFLPTNKTKLFIDTPGLFCIVAAINDFRRGFNGNHLHATNFHSYDGIIDGNFDFGIIENSIAIISASTSGNMAKVLEEKYAFNRSQIVHILYLGKLDKRVLRVVCDLSRHKIENPTGFEMDRQVGNAESCSLCTAGSEAIPLKGDQFNIPGPQGGSLLLVKKDAPEELSEIFFRLGCRGVFGIGLSTSKSQPKEFHVSYKRLEEAPLFKEKLNYILDRSVPAKTKFVVKLNESCSSLAEEVFSKFECNKQTILEIDDIKSMEATTAPVVIVVDVVESGRILQDASRKLRQVCPNAPLLYIVGFSKVLSSTKLTELTNTIIQSDKSRKHILEIIEHLVLPQSKNSNAWQSELGLLQELSFSTNDSAPFTAFLKRRIALLSAVTQPLINNVFLSNNPDADVPLILQPGFSFWSKSLKGSTQADVYFTMASVLHSLRTTGDHKDSKKKIMKSWLQQTILDPENFGRFNDGILQASILRAALPRELNYSDSPDSSIEMAQFVRRTLESHDNSKGEAACEFLLAIATSRLRLREVDLREEVLAVQNLPPFLSFLQNSCRNLITTKIGIS